MFRRLIYILIASLTFSLGLIVTQAYQGFVKRIVRVRPLLVAQELPATPTQSWLKPPRAQSEYQPGVVAIYFTTDVDGKVIEAYVIEGDPSVAQQGVEAASRLRFPRRKHDERLISTAGCVVYKFSGGRRIVLDLEVGDAIGCPN